MDYKIAIPSYKRHDTLKKKTLVMLKEYKVPAKLIHVFVADSEEAKLYRETLEKGTYGKIIIGKPGIKEIRNFMAKYFDEDEKIVYFDDDITKLWRCVSKGNPKEKKDNKLIKLESLDKFIKEAFKLSKKTGFRNWAPYPIDNPFFMKPTLPDKSHISTDLKFLMGGFNGVINNKTAEIRTISDKEDYERTIKYYLADGGVIRYNNISCSTRCYKGMGGIQFNRKKKTSKVNAEILIKRYPDLVTLNESRKSGFVEIKLRDKRIAQRPKGDEHNIKALTSTKQKKTEKKKKTVSKVKKGVRSRKRQVAF